MTEQELRALVREAVERHVGRPAVLPPLPPALSELGHTTLPFEGVRPHCSHVLLKVVAGSSIDEGMCLIEPAVRCNHCGFCQSFGH